MRRKMSVRCLWAIAGAMLSVGCGSSGGSPADAAVDLSTDYGTLDVQFGDGVLEDLRGGGDGDMEIPNRPPLFDPMPAVTVKMGGSVEVELSGYYADPEQKDEELVLSWSAQHVAAESLGGGKLRLVGPVDWSGVDLMAVTVTDGGGLSDTEQMAVTVEKVDAPDPGDVVEDVDTVDVVDVVDVVEDEVEDTKPVCGAVHFQYTAASNVVSVDLAGTFNQWGAGGMWKMVDPEGDHVFVYDAQLDPGEYQYKFVVDGIWVVDPANPNMVDDGYGGKNSVLTVPSCQ